MKTLLVPTDFSDFSEKALNLAIVLAKSLNAKILLQHVVTMPLSVAEVPYPLVQKEIVNLKQKAQVKMKGLALKIEHAGQIQHEEIVDEGEIADQLMQTIHTLKVDLVIMGSKGERNLEKAIFGSITDRMIRQAKCPVMAVPKDLHFDHSIRRISYATDYHKSDVKDIVQLVELAAALKAQVNVLHISGDDIKPEQEKKLMEDFMKLVNNVSGYNNMSFQILHGNNVFIKLSDYISEGNTDILVMATHHRNFFEQLIHKSTTKQVVEHTKVPVIAFHFSAKS
ncbi:MAG TPA: universal stress protein [Bacteroidia bacterium]|nr:universal stress protein [Bacteroidia bacterium]